MDEVAQKELNHFMIEQTKAIVRTFSIIAGEVATLKTSLAQMQGRDVEGAVAEARAF